MFFHNLKYSLKTLFRNKMLIFWTFAFPMILGLFFYMAFSDIEASEKLDIINIAIINTEEFQNNEIYKETLKVLSEEDSEKQLFNTQYVTLEEAKKLLEKGKITGYLLLEDSPKLVVNASGINETIIKFVVEEIAQSEKIIKNRMEQKIKEELEKGNNPENVFKEEELQQLSTDIMNRLQEEVNIKDASNTNLSYTMIEYYTLIAMTCLYGGMLGMVAVNQNLANMSNNGKRVSISPVSKGTLVLSSALAGFITQIIGIILLFLFTIFILHVDYGTKFFYIGLLAFIGCFAGMSLGVALSCLLKTNDNLKTGIILTITMVGCYLSGMMGITMKYIVDKNIPIINKINPASMITDGFYALYYYDTLNRYFLDIISLIIFALIMLLLAIISLRRQKYDSI